jgi:hypothetical protein
MCKLILFVFFLGLLLLVSAPLRASIVAILAWATGLAIAGFLFGNAH